MPKAIPEGLTREHVLKALDDLDGGIEHSFGNAKKFALVHNNKQYSPKAVVGVAFSHHIGRTLGRSEFSEGEKSGQATAVLRNLGFQVIANPNAVNDQGKVSKPLDSQRPIEQARQFLIDEVFDPPLSSDRISKKAKYTLQNSKNWVKEFKKVGDLARYLGRFWKRKDLTNSSHIVDQLESFEFRTFESIEQDFKNRFQADFDDCTSLDDFVIGRGYTSWDLGIFAKTYDLRSGIFLIGEDDNRQAIFIKANFDDGPYANEWLVPGEVLKYYFKGVTNSATGDKSFKETYKDNAAIIKSNQTPIYVFEKQGTSLTLGGIFKYQSHHEEADGAKWFRLERVKLFDQPRRFVKEEHENELQKRIASRQKDSRAERQARLKKAFKKPRSRMSESVVYDRNEDVILEVLERAAGICEWCKEPAPFTRRKNQEPYLEVHHLHPLSEGGDDSDENARALCPNCHRKAHYGDVPNPFLKSSS